MCPPGPGRRSTSALRTASRLVGPLPSSSPGPRFDPSLTIWQDRRVFRQNGRRRPTAPRPASAPTSIRAPTLRSSWWGMEAAGCA
jgi:hypothetical protein